METCHFCSDKGKYLRRSATLLRKGGTGNKFITHSIIKQGIELWATLVLMQKLKSPKKIIKLLLEDGYYDKIIYLQNSW